MRAIANDNQVPAVVDIPNFAAREDMADVSVLPCVHLPPSSTPQARMNIVVAARHEGRNAVGIVVVVVVVGQAVSPQMSLVVG